MNFVVFFVLFFCIFLSEYLLVVNRRQSEDVVTPLDARPFLYIYPVKAEPAFRSFTCCSCSERVKVFFFMESFNGIVTRF